ncbi:MAG: DUF3253 domain-containing protein [Pseudomonadota bacterium]
MDDQAIQSEILRLTARRGPGKTICPSEVARALASDWRPLMDDVRRAAAALAREGRIAVTRKGAPVDAERAAGPIRLGAPQAE